MVRDGSRSSCVAGCEVSSSGSGLYERSSNRLGGLFGVPRPLSRALLSSMSSIYHFRFLFAIAKDKSGENDNRPYRLMKIPVLSASSFLEEGAREVDTCRSVQSVSAVLSSQATEGPRLLMLLHFEELEPSKSQLHRYFAKGSNSSPRAMPSTPCQVSLLSVTIPCSIQYTLTTSRPIAVAFIAFS